MVEIQLPKKFSIRDLYKRAWRITSANLGKIILYQLLGVAVFFALAFLIYLIFPTGEKASVGSQLGNSLLNHLVGIAFAIGATHLALKFSNYEPVQLSDFFTKQNLFITFLLAAFLGGLAVFLGLIAFIIPGIFIAVRFSLYNYFIVDKNEGITESLTRSWNTVKGASWKVLGFFLLNILINMLGALLLGVGLLFTYPITKIATALLYRTLKNQTDITILADETPTELPH